MHQLPLAPLSRDNKHMNFLGMGTLEILIILLIAFIFLGPTKMMDAGRTLGKAVRELRKMAAELPQANMGEEIFGYDKWSDIHSGEDQGFANKSDAEKTPPLEQKEVPDENQPIAFKSERKYEAERTEEGNPSTDHGDRS